MSESLSFAAYKNKLKGRLYHILCTREEGEEWEKYLDSLVIELLTYAKANDSINYWTVIGKLLSLRYLTYPYFRATVFETINLVGGLSNEFSPSEGGGNE